MKIMITFSLQPDPTLRNAAIQRFSQTGGPLPDGAKLLGRWTAADLSHGFLLVETDDADVLAEFCLLWSDIMRLKAVPVIEDAALGRVLSKAPAGGT